MLSPIHVTPSEWPSYLVTHDPSMIFHLRRVLSELPEKMSCPFSLKQMQFIASVWPLNSRSLTNVCSSIFHLIIIVSKLHENSYLSLLLRPMDVIPSLWKCYITLIQSPLSTLHIIRHLSKLPEYSNVSWLFNPNVVTLLVWPLKFLTCFALSILYIHILVSLLPVNNYLESLLSFMHKTCRLWERYSLNVGTLNANTLLSQLPV